MSWTTTAQAISDLRVFLADNPGDKYCYQKRVFGQINGVNTRFKTFERRRSTDFTNPANSQTNPLGSASPLGIYVDGVRVDTTTGIASDNPTLGEVVLVTPPVDGQAVVATYYYQWFLDSDFDQFLQYASRWLISTATYTQVPEGLIPCALNYAAHQAYTKLSLWWSVQMSETFMLEGGSSKENMGVVKSYQDAAENYYKKAVATRDDFYRRQGQSNAPLFGFNTGSIVDTTPRR